MLKSTHLSRSNPTLGSPLGHVPPFHNCFHGIWAVFECWVFESCWETFIWSLQSDRGAKGNKNIKEVLTASMTQKDTNEWNQWHFALTLLKHSQKKKKTNKKKNNYPDPQDDLCSLGICLDYTTSRTPTCCRQNMSSTKKRGAQALLDITSQQIGHLLWSYIKKRLIQMSKIKQSHLRFEVQPLFCSNYLHLATVSHAATHKHTCTECLVSSKYVCIQKWEVNKFNHPVPCRFHWQFVLTKQEEMRKVEHQGFYPSWSYK